jgi:hypothetical protein
MALVCAFGFACGGTGNPTGSPFVKVTPKTSPRPTDTLPQIASLTASETAVPDSTEKPAGPETFLDDFEEPNGWREEQTERYAMGRGEGGIYRMEFFLAGDSQILLSLQPNAFTLPLRDMEVRMEGTAMEANGAYGLVCRYSDSGNYYTFHIALDGRYWLYKQVNGKWTNLGTGTSSAIRDPNTVGLDCVGNTISASVNGTVLEEVRDDSLSEGNAGLFAQPLGGDMVGDWSYYAAFASFEMTVYP